MAKNLILAISFGFKLNSNLIKDTLIIYLFLVLVLVSLSCRRDTEVSCWELRNKRETHIGHSMFVALHLSSNYNEVGALVQTVVGS